MTETVTLAVFVHPFTSVPVTKYVVLTNGLTEIDETDSPLSQIYVFPPLAVIVAVEPLQIEVSDMLIVGFDLMILSQLLY